MDILVILCLCLAFLTLIWMGWIDLKLWILPNELVVLLAMMAFPFHFASDWFFGGWLFPVFGALVGGGTLYMIRFLANHYYGFDTLGWGDIKLMSAVGLWLGAEFTLMALSLGALCGVVHAIGIAFYKKQSLNRMMLPAGPGFIAGSLIVGVIMFSDMMI